MKRLLIVDDNATNRTILEYLLGDFQEENNEQFHFDFAVDGVEAVNMVKHNRYDIIFMDIMMPNMDGVEATRRIREEDKRVLIIAVSAVGDDERKRDILNSGAQDYIAKPINSDILFQRLKNYFLLLSVRDSSQQNSVINLNAINPFSQNVFHREVNFKIIEEEALAEFWEYLNFDANFNIENQNDLADVLRILYDIALFLLEKNITFNITLEESQSYVYFVIVNNKINETEFSKIMKKNTIDVNYILKSDILAFEIKKNSEVNSNQNIEKSKLDNVSDSTISILHSSQPLEVFHYMFDDDLEDLEYTLSELSKMLNLVGKTEVEPLDVQEISMYIDKVGSILFRYSENYILGQALKKFALDIEYNVENFIKKSESIATLIQAFNGDMHTWYNTLFKTGAPDINYMDDSIIINTQTIIMSLSDDDIEDEDDMDDIFDF